MDNQSWFEKFKICLNQDLNEFSNPAELIEEWKIIGSTLIRMAIQFLPPLEKRIIKMLFFRGLTERETATKLEMAKAKVHRLKVRALKLLSKSVLVKLAFLGFAGGRKVEMAI